MRRKAREEVFKLIYQNLYIDIDNDYLERVLKESGLEEVDTEFAKQIFNEYIIRKDNLIKIIEDSLVGYELSRVYKIDLALLLVALTEILHLGTAVSVVVDEILEIAKTYSTEKSPKFINGVLSTVLRKTNV